MSEQDWEEDGSGFKSIEPSTPLPDETPAPGVVEVGAAKYNDARAIRKRLHETHSVENVCKEQDWVCAYPCGGDGEGAPLLPGQPLARAYDGHAVCHLECAKIGNVPYEDNPHVTEEWKRRSKP